jgi:hypothetical protein
MMIFSALKCGIRNSSLLVCLVLVFSNCGYRAGSGSPLSQYSSISVPYVEGDEDGRLTAAIVQRISETGAFKYEQEGGDLMLKVRLVSQRTENIGFQYDRQNDGSLSKRVVPSEARLSVRTECSVVENGSGRVLLGPTELDSSVDYDYDPYSNFANSNVFSLGQLTAPEAAQEASRRPLDAQIAHQIVDLISHSR